MPSGQRAEICRGCAEQNALPQAARHGICVLGATLYCTTEPCVLCSKMLINAGIVRIVFQEPYADPLARNAPGGGDRSGPLGLLGGGSFVRGYENDCFCRG